MKLNVYEWSKSAKPGERVVCHSGDRAPTERVSLPALQAHDEGLVFLAQCRRSIGGHDYEATRISRRTALFLGLIQRREAA